MKTVVALLMLVLSSVSFADSPYRFSQPAKLFAIGDIHGDADSLHDILAGLNLVDANNNWTGGAAYLVMTGDFLDRGVASRQVIELVMKITAQAELKKGKVIPLMGNHEYMVTTGDLRYFSKFDADGYQDFKENPADSVKKIVLNAFSENSKYGQWIASLPAMVMVGDTLFCHGGIEGWTPFITLEQVNDAVHQWVLFNLKLGPEPDRKTRWSVEDMGPMWSRALATVNDDGEMDSEVTRPELAQWLKAWKVRRLVVGHTITEDFQPHVTSELFGDLLIRIDTAISSSMGGQLSAIEWQDGRFVPRFFARKSAVMRKFIEPDGIDFDPNKPKVKPPLRRAPAGDSWTPVECGKSKVELFKTDEPLELSIKGVFPLEGNAMRWGHPEVKTPNPVTPAEIRYEAVGQTKAIPVDVTARGKSRVQACQFKQIRIMWKNGGADKRDGTIFDRSKGSDLKLSAHCDYASGTVAQHAKSNDNVIREFLMYKIIEAAGLPGFKTRLAKIHYVDSNDREQVEGMGFFLESSQTYAARCGLTHVEMKDLNKSLEGMDYSQLVPYLLARILVDASDFIVDIGHNTEPFKDESGKSRMMVPYDFNDSSLVAARGMGYGLFFGVEEAVSRLLTGPFTRDDSYMKVLSPQEKTEWQQTVVAFATQVLQRRADIFKVIDRPDLSDEGKQVISTHLDMLMGQLTKLVNGQIHEAKTNR